MFLKPSENVNMENVYSHGLRATQWFSFSIWTAPEFDVYCFQCTFLCVKARKMGAASQLLSCKYNALCAVLGLFPSSPLIIIFFFAGGFVYQ